MFIENLVLENFKCFGPGRTSVRLDRGMTAFIGANGSGKTAACEALLRLFGISGQERSVRVDDFHVPVGETALPASRELTIEAVLAFPELHGSGESGEAGADDGGDVAEDAERQQQSSTSRAVPEFFRRMAAEEDGDLKVRIASGFHLESVRIMGVNAKVPSELGR